MPDNPSKSNCSISAEGGEITLADQLKALGHPVRLEIIKRLKAMETPCCGEVCDCLPLAQSTVSQHLDVLKKAGLVVSKQVGNRSCFSLNNAVLEAVSQALSGIGDKAR